MSSARLVCRRMQFILFCYLIGFLGVSRGQAQSDESPFLNTTRPFEGREVLRYKVKWSFIRLGTIVMTQQLVDSTDSSKFLVTMQVESAKGLPFIDLYFVDRSLLISNLATNLHFVHEPGREEKKQLVYRYDPESKHIIAEEWENGVLARYDSIPREGSYYDAVGLFMITRCLSRSGLSITAPTIMEREMKDTQLQFTDEIEEIEVDALEQPVRARRFHGNAEWVNKSAAGMKGPFEGWVSDDEAAIPLKADLKIFLGSITLELESYERVGWHSKFASRNDSKNSP